MTNVIDTWQLTHVLETELRYRQDLKKRLAEYERYGTLPPFTGEFTVVRCPTCGMPAAWTHPTVFASLCVSNDDYQELKARAERLEEENQRLRDGK